MNYGELKAQIRATLGVNDPIVNAYIPNFIYQAQQRILREVQVYDLVGRKELTIPSTLTFTPQGAPVLAGTIIRPAEMNRPISASYYADDICCIQLEWRSRSMAELYYPKTKLSGAGKPLYWGWYNPDYLFFFPAPIAPQPVSIMYTQTLPQMTADLDHNKILDFFPNLFLYASLLEASPFLQDDARIAVWDGIYKQICEGYINNNGLQKTDITSDLGVI